MIGINELIAWIGSIIMIAGSVVGYYPQYMKIRKTRNAMGFSTLVSFILITSNSIRIFFWFGKAFDLTLLYQAFAVVFCQTMLVRLCAQVAAEGKKRQSDTGEALIVHKFTDFDINYFWAWTEFESYVQALVSLYLLLSVACLTFMPASWFVEGLGGLALGVEALLAVPQAWRNYKHRSVEGLSAVMIISWCLGDAYKAVYYLITDAPVQFLWCGMFQMMTDVFILFQIFVLYVPGRPPFEVRAFLKQQIKSFMLKRVTPGSGEGAGHAERDGADGEPASPGLASPSGHAQQRHASAAPATSF